MGENRRCEKNKIVSLARLDSRFHGGGKPIELMEVANEKGTRCKKKAPKFDVKSSRNYRITCTPRSVRFFSFVGNTIECLRKCRFFLREYFFKIISSVTFSIPLSSSCRHIGFMRIRMFDIIRFILTTQTCSLDNFSFFYIL